MTSNAHKQIRAVQSQNFFLGILTGLVICTMISGGTALVLASNLMTDQSIEMAEASPFLQ
jgi:hypothetical protein